MKFLNTCYIARKQRANIKPPSLDSVFRFPKTLVMKTWQGFFLEFRMVVEGYKQAKAFNISVRFIACYEG